MSDPVLAWALSQAAPTASLGVRTGIPNRLLDGPPCLVGQQSSRASQWVFPGQPALGQDQCQAYLI